MREHLMKANPAYIAPELLDSGVLSYASDLWAFGCVVYLMAFGRPAFTGTTPFEVAAAVRRGDFTIPHSASGELRDLLVGLLVADPQRRMGWPEFRQHRFFMTQLPFVSMPPEPVFLTWCSNRPPSALREKPGAGSRGAEVLDSSAAPPPPADDDDGDFDEELDSQLDDSAELVDAEGSGPSDPAEPERAGPPPPRLDQLSVTMSVRGKEIINALAAARAAFADGGGAPPLPAAGAGAPPDVRLSVVGAVPEEGEGDASPIPVPAALGTGADLDTHAAAAEDEEDEEEERRHVFPDPLPTAAQATPQGATPQGARRMVAPAAGSTVAAPFGHGLDSTDSDSDEAGVVAAKHLTSPADQLVRSIVMNKRIERGPGIAFDVALLPFEAHAPEVGPSRSPNVP
jgi:hypothetical protein